MTKPDELTDAQLAALKQALIELREASEHFATTQQMLIAYIEQMTNLLDQWEAHRDDIRRSREEDAKKITDIEDSAYAARNPRIR